MLPAADTVLPSQLPVCPEHPERPSLATCERCGRFLCEDCAVTREPPRCADCQARVGDPLGILSQPFSFQRAFAHGWTLFRQALPGILSVSLLFSIPGGLISYYADLYTSSPLSSLRWTMIYEGSVGLIAIGAFLAMMVGLAEGQRVGVSGALRQGLAAWPGLFGASFRQSLQVMLYSLLFLVPGFIRASTLYLSSEAAFREPGRDALQASTALVTGRRWEVFCLLVASYALNFMAVIFLSVGVGITTELLPSTTLGMEVLLDAGGRIGQAFTTAVGLAAYYGFKSLHGEPLAPR
jgi:hypothetical protein